MLQRPRFQMAAKALILLALALFLYTRLADGTLFFYINQRFMLYTVLAVVGLVVVAISYRAANNHPDDAHSHHAVTWGGLALVLLPVVLGVLVPPQPLGAAAIGNREIAVSSQPRNVLPAAVRAAAQKDATDRNLLDWLNAFSASSNAAQEFAGQPVDVIGFVYHDERLADDQVLISRFIVSCCVADANVVTMVVRWPDAATLENDAWVRVQGVLEPGAFNGAPLPVVAAQSITPVAMPEQPYLYP
ncbi:MAG TPA: TIGR03943 family protein [Chloroflexi bacterium]|nr:TIGR03943 family protein [Chloroflexota bacterium]